MVKAQNLTSLKELRGAAPPSSWLGPSDARYLLTRCEVVTKLYLLIIYKITHKSTSALYLLISLFHDLFKIKFPSLTYHGRGSRQLGVGRRGPALRGRRRLKYDRRHMAKAQKLTSLKRT